MKKIVIIGHFGFGGTYLDGQTVKTKTVAEELTNELGESEVGLIDTHGGKKSLPKLFFKAASALKKSKNVVMLPAHNGLKFFTPLLVFFNKIYRRKLFYIVIGGWLPEYLETQKRVAKSLKKFDGIFVETQTMRKALSDMGYKNVYVMPNFKRLNVIPAEDLSYHMSEPYRLCTFSRVSKQKGIADAVMAVCGANAELGRVAYTLDIFGQVDKDQTEWFENLKSEFPQFVNYGGCVPFDRSVEVLKEYFALLFPTFYEGEGFAGTVLDAFAAGVPVFASDWRYNGEIINDRVTGRIFKAKSADQLTDILVEAANNPSQILDMKKKCVEEAHKYAPKMVLKVLLDKMA